MAKLKLDLHDIYNRGGMIDAELDRIVQEALDRKIGNTAKVTWAHCPLGAFSNDAPSL